MALKAIIVGRVGKDGAEVKQTPGGKWVANFSVASTDHFTTDAGKQERTEWCDCEMWAGLAEKVGPHVKQGTQLYIEARIETRPWTDKESVKRYSTVFVVQEIELLGSPRPAEDKA